MKPHCREILERAYVLLDGEIGIIGETERLEIETHLHDCQPCLERYGLEREVLAIIQRLRGVHPQCPGTVRDRIAALLREV